MKRLLSVLLWAVTLPAQDLEIRTSSLENGRVGRAYSENLQARGGEQPYAWSISAGALPPGIQLNAQQGRLSGTPTQAGNFTFTLRVRDDEGDAATRQLTLAVEPSEDLTITTASPLPPGTTGAPYTYRLTASGGIPLYSWSLESGALPAGLSLASSGDISGVPTAAGVANFTVRVRDLLFGTATKALQLTIALSGPPLSIATMSLPSGTVGSLYAASISASGGTPPYTFALTAGALPSGLTIAASGTVSGTPQAAGTASFTVRVTDAANASATRNYLLTISAPSVTVSTPSLPGGTVGSAYSTSLTAAGGRAPYTWALAAGTLPSGLTLAASGTITGTPQNPGVSNFTVRATDASNVSGERSLSITIAPAPLAITSAALPGGTVGAAYSATATASGGTPPYAWTVAAGSLPAGLTLAASGAISGTPQSAGTANFTLRVTDAANVSASRALAITIAAAPAPPLAITTTALPGGTVNTPYSATLASSGGTPPVTWALASGALPAGLTLAANGSITGTPQAAGTASFIVRAQDSAGVTADRALSITIAAAPAPPLVVTTTALPSGTVNTPYSATLASTGGTPPVTWAIASGALPAGLTLASNGSITGTPQAAGTANFVVRARDNAGATTDAALSVTIAAAPAPPLAITTTALPSGTVNAPYSASLSSSGGTPPVTWAIASGALPAGLTLASNGSITGTPQTPGTASFVVRARDNAGVTTDAALSITIAAAPAPPLAISTTALPGGAVNAPYAATLTSSGGTPPVTWTLASGALPAGLTLAANGSVTGAPQAPGTANFVVRARDNAGVTADRALSIAIQGPAVAITTAALPGATTGAAYGATLAASGGTQPYRWTLAGGALPDGIALATNGQLTGIPQRVGSFPFTVRVSDASGTSVDRALSITVSQGIAPGGCPSDSAAVGAAYSATLTATGGTPPYVFASAANELPPGLTMSSGGVLSGIPSTAGSYLFQVRITDSSGAQIATRCSIVVRPAVTLTSAAVSDATLQIPYVFALAATGGSAPYAWSVASGALPPGIALDARTGVLSGTPSQPGRSTFTIRVTDSAGIRSDREFTLTVAAGLTISACPPASATAGQPYSATLSASGGESPYAWSIAQGSLPAGISLNVTGSLGGTPTSSATAQFVLRVTDTRSASATRACSLEISEALSIQTASLPSGSLSVPYSEPLVAAEGAPPYRWSSSAGSLPPGLALSPATGLVTGTPTDTGTFRFTARVSDARNATADRDFSITIAAGLVIPSCPVPVALLGRSYFASLAATAGQPPFRWSVSGGALPSGLGLDAATGAIAGTPATTGDAEFRVTVTDGASATASRSCSINVREPGFEITSASDLPAATVGVDYSAALGASGGRAPYAWTIAGGSLPPGLQLDAAGRIGGVPTATGAFTFALRASDAAGASVTQSFRLAVADRAPVRLSLRDLPASAGAAEQLQVVVEADAPVPVGITGEVRLTFESDAGADDPAIQFAGGGRRAPLRITAGERQGTAAFQTGTVAGTIVVTASVPGQPAMERRVRIDRSAPRIVGVSVIRTTAGIEVRITGFSTSREVVSGTFRFTPAPGSTLASSELTVPLTDAAQRYFSGATAQPFGGQFLLVQPFTITNANVTGVSVTLTNSVGTSAAVATQF